MGYALLKAKSSKILKQDGFAAEDETAEGICSLYVHMDYFGGCNCSTVLDEISTNGAVIASAVSS